MIVVRCKRGLWDRLYLSLRERLSPDRNVEFQTNNWIFPYRIVQYPLSELSENRHQPHRRQPQSHRNFWCRGTGHRNNSPSPFVNGHQHHRSAWRVITHDGTFCLADVHETLFTRDKTPAVTCSRVLPNHSIG